MLNPEWVSAVTEDIQNIDEDLQHIGVKTEEYFDSNKSLLLQKFKRMSIFSFFF